MDLVNTMNLRFAQEFSNLVIRYTKEPLPNSSSDNKQSTDLPLTKQEVVTVVKNVLVTLLGINDINFSDASLKTPTNEIAVSTPIASIDANDISRSANNGDTCRSKSQGIQETPKNSNVFNSDLRTNDTEKKNTTLEVFQDGKKFISRSSPAICVNNVGRSDTFVLDESQTATDMKQFNDPFAKVEVTNATVRLINEARVFAINIVETLDELKKQTFPPSLSARRLSTNDINFGRVSNVTRLTVPAKVRRSISEFPGTPTSSKSLTTDMDKRKNLGASSETASRKLGSMVTRSISNLHLSSNNKSLESISRPTKNPKYAHVQSTIPKPISNKRKA